MRNPKRLVLIGASILAVAALATGTLFVRQTGTRAASAGIQGTSRTISSDGTTSFSASAQGSDVAYSSPEFVAAQGDTAGAGGQPAFGGVNRSFSSKNGTHAPAVAGTAKAKSDPQVVTSFDGLNHRQNRLANHANQFSLEPPDQGLCAGNGVVLETVNDVLRVYDQSGNALSAPTALNAFYGYAPAIVRSTHTFGPFVTDPSCYFDTDTQRWFHVVLTIDTKPANGHFTGPNHLDLAVSNSSDPTGTWTIYRLPAQDDGTAGTPNHGCSFGPCFGDYPHIGADANGFYITTNEYSFFGPEFHGAQVYALSKRALASGASTVTVTQFDTHSARPGFTIWPATTPGGQYETANGGTEYFLSSTAADEVNVPDFSHAGPGQSNNILMWSLTNTASLDSASPAVSLSNTSIGVNTYAMPPKANQKAGNFPLGQCLNDAACATFLNLQPDPFAPEVLSPLDSNDTRMQQVTYANGKVWGALDTGVSINGSGVAGIAYYIINPHTAGLVVQGTVGMADTNLTYPAIGVTPSGRGVVAFTLVGTNDYPSAAYAGIDANAGFGDVHIAAAGAGPQDGFSGYNYYGNPPGTNRPRWGDYGATAVVGDNIWIASEYIGQTCTLAEYEGTPTSPFGSCGGTRTSLANWDTRITEVSVK